MKLKLNHIAVLVLALFAGFTFEADAQVSVRRTPKREKTEKKAPKKKESKAEADNTQTPKQTAATTQQTAERKNTSAANSSVAKRTAAQKAKQQEAAVVADGKTLRQQAFDDYQRQDATDVPWQHVVYRELDLEKGANASLYYPVEPQDGMTNLFRVIIDLMANNQLKVYEYLDGREVFTEKYLVKPSDIFDKFQITYTTEPAKEKGNAPVYKIEESDVPSNEVLSYFIKERWEFDQKVSKYGPKILCICPVLHRSGDWGGDVVKYPMMWINFEDLRPFLREHLVVSDGMNTAPRFTMEDYFALQQYQGDIYKVQNLRGLSLMQQYPNPDSLKVARAKIEAQLRGFGDSIWVQPVKEDVADTKATRKSRKAKKEEASETSSDGTEKKNRRTKETVDMDAAEAEQDAKLEAEEESIERTGAAHSVRRSRR